MGYPYILKWGFGDLYHSANGVLDELDIGTAICLAKEANVGHTYYHLTSESCLAGILEKGLVPQRGARSNSVCEDRSAVFLCKEEDIPYWQILLNQPVLLKVDMTSPIVETFCYSCYNEYLYDGIISPEHLSVITHNASSYRTNDVMTVLCRSYLDSISRFTCDCAYYYSGQANYPEDYLLDAANSLIAVLSNLNYNITDMSMWEKYVADCGSEGEYTFCDWYCETDSKLWEQLIKYPSDNLADARQWIYDFVDEMFPFAKTLSTGGLTLCARGETYDDSKIGEPSIIFN